MMSIDLFFKYSSSQEDVKSRLNKYLYSEDEQFNQLTLNYLGKWIWVYFEKNNDNTDILTIELSHAFSVEEQAIFVGEMQSLGFTIDEE
jgi:hypothetical protein